MKRVTALSAAVSLVGAFSCGKDESKPLSTTELLLARAWRVTAATVQVNGGAATDVFRSRDNCVKDNTYSFRNGSEVVVNEGTLKCATADAQNATGRWTLVDSTLSVTATSTASARNYGFSGTVRSIDQEELLLITTRQSGDTVTVSRTTFEAQ